MTLREAANRYVDLTIWIRELSSPQLTNINDEETYREKLLINFRRIGEIAGINNGLLADELMPVLESSRLLTEEEITVLQELKDKLLDAYTMNNLDVAFLNLLTTRLSADAERKQDEGAIIRSLDDYVMASYALLGMARVFIRIVISRSNAGRQVFGQRTVSLNTFHRKSWQAYRKAP